MKQSETISELKRNLMAAASTLGVIIAATAILMELDG
jgi:hypothetical protein